MRQKARHHNRVTPFICFRGTNQFINLVGQVSLKPKCSPYRGSYYLCIERGDLFSTFFVKAEFQEYNRRTEKKRRDYFQWRWRWCWWRWCWWWRWWRWRWWRRVTQHIPTMTKSHHGGKMSVMIKVGICQWQNPTIHEQYYWEYICLKVPHITTGNQENLFWDSLSISVPTIQSQCALSWKEAL